MSDLIHGLVSLNNAVPAYEEAEKYYNGDLSEIFSTDKVKKLLKEGVDAFTFNYSRMVVTSRLSRMEISSVTTEDSTTTDLIEQVWNDNSLDQEFQDAFEAALVFGDSYLMAWPNEETVDVFYNSPKDVRVFYDVENPRKKAYAIKRWMDGDKLRVNLYYVDRIEKYISKTKPSANMQDQDFEAYIEEGQDSWPLPNETGSIPVFHLRTARQYGRPEHKNSYSPQNAINKLLAVQLSSMDFTSFPQRYILEDAATDGVNPLADFGIAPDEDDADLSNLKAGPGGVWSLKNVKSVGQFDTTSPDTFVTPFKTYVDALATTTQTPMHLFQIGSLPSGAALRAAEAPLNKRVGSLETLFGGVIREMYEYILECLGYEERVAVTWDSPATYDDSDIWAVVDAKVASGVPLRKALVEAGYTEETVNEWYPEGEPARSTKELAVLADAVQKLGAAASLGILSTEEIRALLPDDIKLEAVADLDAVAEAVEAAPVAAEDDGIKEKADALGILIRAGVDPDEAARRVGLAGVEFTGAMPTSLRLPEAEAAKLEEA